LSTAPEALRSRLLVASRPQGAVFIAVAHGRVLWPITSVCHDAPFRQRSGHSRHGSRSGREHHVSAHRQGWVNTSFGPRNGSPHPPRISTLRYVHLGFVFVLAAERSPAEGSVGQIFKCLKRLDDFHANPKRAGSAGKRRKGFGDPISRLVESLRFACLR
jgi:hypothetical protein